MNFDNSELEKIAEELRINITGNKAVTIADYVSLASTKKGDELGLFYLWAVKTQAGIGRYFPIEVFQILKTKVGRHFYSDKDKKFLIENARNGVKYLAWQLNVPPHSVHKQARLMQLSISRRDYDPYSEEENSLINSEGLNCTDSEIAKKLVGRTSSAIQHKRLNAGIKKRVIIHWEDHPEKERYLLRNYGKQTYDQIAEHLGLRYYQIKTKVERLKHEGRISRHA